jgi:hypothetical protein
MENLSLSRYIEIATRIPETGLVKRGKLAKVESEQDIATNPPHNVDKWRSHWEYDHTAQENDLKNAIRYVGDVILDYDFPGVPEAKILQYASEFYPLFLNGFTQNNLNPESLSMWMSGNKGFHVHMRSDLFANVQPDINIHVKVKAFVQDFCDEAGIPYPDMSLYNWSSVYRMKNSVHPASKKTKYPIMEYKFSSIGTKPEYNCEYIDNFFSSIVVQKISLSPQKTDMKTDHFAACGQTLYNMGFMRAKTLYGRHDSVFRLAVWMKFNHMPYELTKTAIFRWLESGQIPFDINDTNRVISDVYTVPYNMGCTDHIFTQLCDSNCPLYTSRPHTNLKPK